MKNLQIQWNSPVKDVFFECEFVLVLLFVCVGMRACIVCVVVFEREREGGEGEWLRVTCIFLNTLNV